MYGNLDSIDAAYRTRAGMEPLVPATEGGPDAQLEDVEPAPEPMPNESWTKAEITDWLTAHGIDAPSSATKAELIYLVE